MYAIVFSVCKDCGKKAAARGLIFEPVTGAQLLVVQGVEEQLGGDGADAAEGHVFLRVPDIALGAQEILRARVVDLRDGPFEEFVRGTDREADAGDEEEEPLAWMEGRAANEDLSRDHRGDEALDEVGDTVVVIAREVEGFLCPEADGHACVGVVPADDEDGAVERDEDEDEWREREAFVRCEDDHDRKDGGEDLEGPRPEFEWVDAGPDEERERDGEEGEGKAITVVQRPNGGHG